MTVKEILLEVFLATFEIGQTFTKGEIYRSAKNADSSIKESTVGWIISLVLVGLGYIVLVGKDKNGANIYKRIK